MRISGCVIVKNEENNINRWLKCMSDVADEMIVVDTGSTDNTVNLAKKAGAKIFNFKWINDFASAKNYAISKAKGDWIIFLDADEYFTPATKSVVRKVIEYYNKDKKNGCVMCKLTDIDADRNGRIIGSMMQVRIFRNIPEIRYEGKIHENIRNKKGNRRMIYSREIEIYHTGYSSSIMKKKAERNLVILEEKQRLEGDTPEVVYFMMDAYNSLGRYEEAVKYARMSIESNVNMLGSVGHNYEILISAMLSAKYPLQEIFDVMDEAMEKYPKESCFPLEKGYLLWQHRDYYHAQQYIECGFNLRADFEKEISKGKYLTDNSSRLLHYAYEALGSIMLLKGDKTRAGELFIQGIRSFKYNVGLLRGLYKCVSDASSTDIIELVDSYYDRKTDAAFICSSLLGVSRPEIYAYYNKYNSNDKALAFMKLRNYDSAGIEAAHELTRQYNYALVGASMTNRLSDNILNIVLPSIYCDILRNGFSKNDMKNNAVKRLLKYCKTDSIFVDSQKNPLVSIMIPTYNRPNLFEQTLLSALDQTYENVEIIVNDNSTNDDTEHLIQKYLMDRRIRYYRNRHIQSKKDNFSPFEHQARGSLLQWCMDDDVLSPNKLEVMVHVLRDNPNVTLVTSRRAFIDGNGKQIDQETRLDINGEYALYSGHDIGKVILLNCANFIGEPSATLFRRNDLQHHYWQADCKGLLAISDVAMWLELMEKGDCVIFRDPLSAYRRHSDQEGQQTDVILLSRLEWIKLINEYYEKKIFIDSDDYYKKCLEGLYDEYKKNLSILNQYRNTKNFSEYKHAMLNIGELLNR